MDVYEANFKQQNEFVVKISLEFIQGNAKHTQKILFFLRLIEVDCSHYHSKRQTLVYISNQAEINVNFLNRRKSGEFPMI